MCKTMKLIKKIKNQLDNQAEHRKATKPKNTRECNTPNKREKMITANNHQKPALHCHSQDNFRRHYSIMKAISLRLRRGAAEFNTEKKGEKFHISLS